MSAFSKLSISSTSHAMSENEFDFIVVGGMYTCA